MGGDPFLAYVAGGIVAVLWFVNGKSEAGAGVMGFLGRAFVALLMGALVGAATFFLFLRVS